MVAYKWFTQTEFVLGGGGYVTNILVAENEQKVDNFEPIDIGKYRF